MNWKLKFGVIWSGQAISVFTSSVLQMALIWHIAIDTNSALMLSIASFAGFLPRALLGPLAGALVDRWSRKLTIIGADLYIALISLALGVFAVFTAPPIWFILVILFLRSIGSAFHTPAISAITPLIVPEENLTKCAGYSSSLESIGFIAGTSVAAILNPIWGIGGMVWLDVAGAVIASIAVMLVKIPSLTEAEGAKAVSGANGVSDEGEAESRGVGAASDLATETDSVAAIESAKINGTAVAKAAESAEDSSKGGLLSEVGVAFAVLRKQKGLFALLWIGFAFCFVFSPINALFPLMSMGYFGGTEAHAAVAEVTFAIGMIVGGLLLGVWGGFKNRAVTMALSVAIMGVALGISGALPVYGFIIFAVLSGFMGFSAPLYNGPAMALVQEKIEPEFLGRIFGVYGSLMSAAMLLGLAVSGPLADIVGVNNWFLISGIIITALAAVTIMTPNVRNIEKE